MNKTHIRAYTKALVESAMNRQIALEIELAVGFAVMIECDNARRLARETMLTIYNAAGWKCDKPGAIDWRAVNRRISAAIALHDFIGVEDLEKWAGESTARDMVEAFRPHIAALKLKSVNEVLLACDKLRPAKKSEGVKINAGHLHLTIPANTTREDLISMATKLMQMAVATDMSGAEEHEEQEDEYTA